MNKKAFKRGILSIVFAATAIIPAMPAQAHIVEDGGDLAARAEEKIEPATIKVFGQTAYAKPLATSPLAKRWNDMMQAEKALGMVVCETHYAEIKRQWDDVTAIFPLKDAWLVKASVVNSYVNKLITWTADDVVYDRGDFFAPPSMTCQSLKGDCDDFAILKYYLLRHLGVPADRLMVAFVDTYPVPKVETDHAVLLMNVAAEGQEFVMLDNRFAQPIYTEDSKYGFIGALNENGRWKYWQPKKIPLPYDPRIMA